MLAKKECGYGAATLIEVSEHISVKYSSVYLEAIALLTVPRINPNANAFMTKYSTSFTGSEGVQALDPA